VESKLSPLGMSAIYWPIVPAPGDCEDGEYGGMNGRGNPGTRRKPAPTPLCPPQIPKSTNRWCTVFEHFFKITMNYSAIAILHNSLQHAPFSSLFSQLRCSAECLQDNFSARTTHRKQMSHICYHASPLARWLDLQKTHHVTATQLVHWRADCCLATIYNIHHTVAAGIAGCLSSRCLAMFWTNPLQYVLMLTGTARSPWDTCILLQWARLYVKFKTQDL
jgi:hypothetical protein